MLNQVLVRFGESVAVTEEVIAAVQRCGICWMEAPPGTGRRLMRIPMSCWQTAESGADRSPEAILPAAVASAGSLA